MDVGLELRREDLEVEHHTFLDQAWGTSVRPCVMPVNWAMKPPHQTPIVLVCVCVCVANPASLNPKL